MSRLLAGLGSIAYKELLHIRRDPTTLVFALLVPVMQLMLFGFAVNYDVRHVATVVVDQDRSRESRAYVQGLVNTGYLEMTGTAESPEAAERILRRGDARVALVIPPDFARRYGTSDPPTVGVLLDGSDSQVANPARLAFRPPEGTPTVEPRIDVLYNPDGRTQVYTIPGLVGVILQLVTVSLTAFSLVREREQGSLDQLMVSPVGRLGLMLGKLLPYAGLATVELGFVLYLARLLFDVRVTGSVVVLTALSVPFIVAGLAMGLLISTLARTQAQALQMTFLTILPSILLSGYIAPRETLPGALSLLSLAFPVTHFIQIARGIMVRGAGAMDVMPSALALVGLATVLLVLATLRFQKSAGD